VQRIFLNELHLYLYKIKVVHEPTARDKQRLEFAVWAEHEEVTMHSIWFSDEAHFNLDGVVNKKNVLFWASENPRVLTEKTHHVPKITVWVAISSFGLIRPVFSAKL
jgi:hypothetical protein